ncbi:tRNA (adenosine(37)-N6)-dimethylallyltransferase MiaA [Phenylobacterium sp.]|uniref:tRNA (adenosine(37)-N6)-dimethylallyltransferase MiaA n=1 Tax=Phenylobacterium sp. TaxID=1871053 RepID=UPI002FCC8500
MEPRIWLIAGPTASGKSALALRLAETIGGEIINADALQLYADLRVLSARPSPEEEARAPHHLFGVADAADGWSVGRWVRAATGVLDEIAARDRPAVVVGGTGLYFSALTDGLADIPPVAAEARAEAERDFDTLSEIAFRSRLAFNDPVAAERIAPGDRQRLVRAWTVFAATGTALTEWQSRTEPALALGSWRTVALDPPREILYERCDTRFEFMLHDGAITEVEALAARGLDPALPALKAVGYRELAAYLQGKLSLEQAQAEAQRETRRYAKRQSTWMRGRMAAWPRIDAVAPEDQWRQFLALHPVLTP